MPTVSNKKRVRMGPKVSSTAVVPVRARSTRAGARNSPSVGAGRLGRGANAGRAAATKSAAALARELVLDARMAAGAVDKEKAARATVLLQKIAKRKARIAQDFWFIGVFLRELLRHKLYAALGFDSFRSMLAQHRVVSFTLAKKLIAIADKVPKKVALGLGQEKSYALVEYINATAADDSVSELVESNTALAGKPLSASSAREVREAAQVARRNNPRGPAARAREARARQAEEKLRDILARLGLTTPVLTRVGTEWNLRLSLAEVEALRVPPRA